MGKNLPAVWEIWVSSLSWEDPPEEGMATHSSIPAWRIPWTEKPGELSFMGCKELDTTEATKHSTCKKQRNNRDFLYSTGHYI